MPKIQSKQTILKLKGKKGKSIRIRLHLLSTAIKAWRELNDIFQDLKVNKYLEKVSTKINGEIRILPGTSIMSTKLTLQKILKRLLYIEKEKDIFNLYTEKKNVFHENQR